MVDEAEQLSAEESALIEAWRVGRPFDAADADSTIIRAQVLRSLILGTREGPGVAPGRLTLRRARISGELDLSYIIPGSLAAGSLPALRFENCVFESPVLLSKSSILSLTVWGCTVPQLALMNTRVDGDLDLTGSTLGHEALSGKTTLRGEGLSVAGRIAMNKIPGDRRFVSHGPIRMIGARIGGNLEASGASMSSGGDRSGALILDGAEIEGNLFLRGSKTMRFEAKGCVQLSGLTVKRDIGLEGASLDGVGSSALSCHRAVVGGALRLARDDRPFQAKGGLKLSSLVAETVEVSGARLDPNSTSGMTLDLRRASIAGALTLKDISRLTTHANPTSVPAPANHSSNAGRADERPATVEGRIDLSGATVGIMEDDAGSFWPTRGELVLEGLSYRSIAFPDHESDKAKSRLEWLALQYAEPPGPDKFKPQPYEQLARVLRDHGYSQDADVVAMRKRDWAITCRTEKGVNIVLTRLMKIVAGHGYERHAALTWTGLWWVIGIAAIYAGSLAGVLEFKAANPELPRHARIEGVAPSKGLAGARVIITPESEVCDNLLKPLYALELMVPFVEFGQVADCDMKAVGPGASALVAARAFYQIVGFLLLTILGVTLTGLLRKD